MFEVGQHVHWLDGEFEGDGTVTEVRDRGSYVLYIVVPGTCPAGVRKRSGYDRYGFYEDVLTAI